MAGQVPSPQTTLVILLGASEWPLSPNDFPGSQAFANSARALKEYFLSPQRFGLPQNNLLDLFDTDQSADDVDRTIGDFLERRIKEMRASGNTARDLLVYYVGHGAITRPDSEFCLAIRRTRSKNLRASSIWMKSLAETLKETARNLRRVLIIDCCFASSAFYAFQSAPGEVARLQTIEVFEVKAWGTGFPGKGTSLFCSSGPKEASLISKDGAYTTFTRALLDTLSQGGKRPQDYLSLRNIAELTEDVLHDIEGGAPRPYLHSPDQSEGDIADIPFFPNPYAREERRRRAEEMERNRVLEAERLRKAQEVVQLQKAELSPPAPVRFPLPSQIKRIPNSRLAAAVLFLLAIVVGGSGISFLAWGNSYFNHTNATNIGNSSIPIKGGTWIDDLYEEPSSLIPNGTSETFANLVDETIWAPLFIGKPDGTIAPGLVSEMPTTANGDISSDLKTWTFKLRPGLKWSDGQPLDARDVDFSWKLWNNPNFGAAITHGFNLIQSATVSPDNLSITFHLSQPFSPFLASWTDGAVAPMPAHIFSKMSPANILRSTQNMNPTVSSGPFTMTTSKPGDQYVVSRNPNYYLASQGLPYLDKIVFRIVTDQNIILKDAQAGAIDSAWFLDVTKTSTYQQLSNYSIVKAPVVANYEAIHFNQKNPILQNVTIRTAIAMAIDRTKLVQAARYGEATPLCTNHASAYKPGYEANAPCPQYNPTLAKALLQNDGWQLGSDGVFARAGKRLEFQYSATANNAWRAKTETIIQQELAAIGIKIDITNYPASTFFGTFLPQGQVGQYDLSEYENSYTYDPDDATEYSCAQIPSATNSYGGENYSFYCNHQLDQFFAQEESTTDYNARQQVFNQIHQTYLTDFPFVTLYAPIDPAIAKNVTHNYVIGSMGASETVNIMNWWCTKGTC